ncbi:MAG: TolC family protein [Peptococcaceae bacterium]|jgi:hypothetical protein|nr:TolC family protein [Peptococcaceae bacterium]
MNTNTRIKNLTKGLAVTAAALILLQIAPVGAADEKALTIAQVVQTSAANDLSQQITDLEKGLKNQRAAYSPTGASLGAGPWAVTYAMSIAPLLQSASSKATDYQETVNKNFQNEYGYYGNAYTLWLAGQNLQYQLANYNQSANEKEMAQQKLDQGTASQNDMLKAEISFNKAKADYLKTDGDYQSLLYKINQTMGAPLSQQFGVNDVSVVFLPESELQAEPLISDLQKNHTSLEAIRQLIYAYEHAYEIADGQTDIRVPVEGIKGYYTREIEEANLKLKQAQNGIELAIRVYTNQLRSLQARIQLDQEAVEKMDRVYDNATKLYEVGMSTFDDMEKVRLSLVQLQLQLAQDQKDYLLLTEKFRLFKLGATFAE